MAQAAGDARCSAPDGVPHRERSPTSCIECWGCVRYCPARAMRVVDDHSEIIPEKCVKCGLCVSECGNCGHLVRDDTPRVRELLASEPAGRRRARLGVRGGDASDDAVPRVERALESVGFYAVESTVIGEELVAIGLRAGARARRAPSAAALDVPGGGRRGCASSTPQLIEALVPRRAPLHRAGAARQERLPRGRRGRVRVARATRARTRCSSPSSPAPSTRPSTSSNSGGCSHRCPSVRTSEPRPPAGTRRPAADQGAVAHRRLPSARRSMSRDMTDHDVVVVRGLHELDQLLAAIDARRVRAGRHRHAQLRRLHRRARREPGPVACSRSATSRPRSASARRRPSVGSRALLGTCRTVGHRALVRRPTRSSSRCGRATRDRRGARRRRVRRPRRDARLRRMRLPDVRRARDRRSSEGNSTLGDVLPAAAQASSAATPSGSRRRATHRRGDRAVEPPRVLRAPLRGDGAVSRATARRCRS